MSLMTVLMEMIKVIHIRMTTHMIKIQTNSKNLDTRVIQIYPSIKKIEKRELIRLIRSTTKTITFSLTPGCNSSWH